MDYLINSYRILFVVDLRWNYCLNYGFLSFSFRNFILRLMSPAMLLAMKLRFLNFAFGLGFSEWSGAAGGGCWYLSSRVAVFWRLWSENSGFAGGLWAGWFWWILRITCFYAVIGDALVDLVVVSTPTLWWFIALLSCLSFPTNSDSSLEPAEPRGDVTPDVFRPEYFPCL